MLERKEFLPSLPPLSTRIPEPHVTPELTIEAHIVQLIYTTLRTWLSYPTTPTSLIQGAFIQILITAFKTSDILLHDGIWDVFIQPMKAFFPVHLRRQTTLNASDLQPFHNALMSIPAITDATSPDNLALQHFLGEVQRLRVLSRNHKSIPMPANHTPHLSIPHAPSNLESVGLERLRQFVMDCYGTLPYLRSVTTGDMSQLTPLQQWCLADQDKRLCFRELATGRWRMTQPQGAAHPEMFELPGAIASIFIHRGITFSCPFSHEQATYYASFAAWQQQLTACQANTASLDPEYICSKTAYGTPIAGRSASWAERYFQAESHYRHYFREEKSYKAAQAEFLATNSTTKSKYLPQIGSLIATLLASDFVYAGKVTMPTAAEMGTLVHHLKMGANSGLQILTLIPQNATQEQVQEAFVKAYDHLNAAIPPDVKEAMKFDVIMLEHALCKLKRWDNDRMGRRK